MSPNPAPTRIRRVPVTDGTSGGGVGAGFGAGGLWTLGGRRLLFLALGGGAGSGGLGATTGLVLLSAGAGIFWVVTSGLDNGLEGEAFGVLISSAAP